MNSQQRKLIAMLSLCTVFIVPSVASAAPISGQGTWESTLQGRDLDGNLSTFEAYYDTTLNITWLADANYGAGSTYDDIGWLGGTTTDGRMTWANANAWATNLNPYGSGITGWRLPTHNDVGDDGATFTNYYQGVDYGYNVTAHSEMSHLFYVTLGNTAWYTTSGVTNGCAAPAYCLSNSGLFSNIQSDDFVWSEYWSSTEQTPATGNAWTFNYTSGSLGYYDKINNYYAWAVHAGDVGASAVPVPAAAWLFGSGLFGLASVSRRKAA